MRGLTKFVAVITMISTFCVSAYAQSQNYSDLQVEVTRTTQTEETLIYTGLLSGYDNGAWVNYNFDEDCSVVIFDWNSAEGETICIRRADAQVITGEIEQETEAEKINTSEITTVKDKLEAETNDVYPLTGENNMSAKTDELQIDTEFKRDGRTLFSVLSIKNKTVNLETVQIVVAAYKSGEMLSFARQTNTLDRWGMWNPKINILLPEEESDISIKVMVWNPDDMTPYCDVIELNGGLSDVENEILLNEPTEIMPGRMYVFKPKSDGVYAFEGGTSLNLYQKSLGNIMPIALNSVLTYPNHYYIESETQITVTVEKTGNYIGEQSFKVNDYFSDMANGGNLYKGPNRLYRYLSRWIAGGSGIYFNSDGLKYLNPATDEISEVITDANPYYIVTDETGIYYADWKKSGMIYKYETETDTKTLVCKDKAIRLQINEDYIYYRNLLDGGKLYRIEKNAVEAEQGEPIEN